MTINERLKELARREGKKSEVTIQNLREVYKILARMMAEDSSFVAETIKYGEKSLKKK